MLLLHCLIKNKNYRRGEIFLSALRSAIKIAVSIVISTMLYSIPLRERPTTNHPFSLCTVMIPVISMTISPMQKIFTKYRKNMSIPPTNSNKVTAHAR